MMKMSVSFYCCKTVSLSLTSSIITLALLVIMLLAFCKNGVLFKTGLAKTRAVGPLLWALHHAIVPSMCSEVPYTRLDVLLIIHTSLK